jgi:hypothetical protein
VTVAAEKSLTGITIELLPPASDACIAPTHEAPVEQDRSFFVVPDPDRVTPIDPLTNIPLPLLPPPAVLPRHKGDYADWHHAFHPREHPLLQTTAGLAVRHSRVQLVERTKHNELNNRYHKFYDGPPLPGTDEDSFKVVAFASAGFLPSQAIDTRSGEPEVVDLTKGQTAMLRRPRVDLSRPPVIRKRPGEANPFEYWHVRYSFDAVRAFFSEYVLDRSAEYASEDRVEEFLHTRDENKQQQSGIDILKEQIEFACEDMADTYGQLWAAGSLHPLAPNSAKQFVFDKMGGTTYRKLLVGRLFGVLAVTQGVTGLTIRGERAIL